MILKDVGTVARRRVGQGAPAGPGARIMRITTDAGSFETPARLLTASEHRARSEASISKALPHELAMDFRPMSKGDAARLAAGGRAPDRMIATARQFESYTRRATLRLTVFQPPANALKGMSAEEKTTLADAQARILENDLGTGIVTYPYLGLNASLYERFVAERCRRSQAPTALFVLHMGMAPAALDKVLGMVAARKEPAIVPLIYKSPSGAVRQHRVLARHLDNPRVALLACQVPRTVKIGGRAVSGPHAAAIASGYDMVALKQHHPSPASPKPDLGKIAFFTRDTLRVDGIQGIIKRGGRDLEAEFGLNAYNGPDRRHIAEMLGGFAGAAVNRKKFQQMRYLAKVHEAINSPPEFARMRAMIAAGQFGRYVSATLAPAAAMAYAAVGPAQTSMPDYFGPALPAAPGRRAATGGVRDGKALAAA